MNRNPYVKISMAESISFQISPAMGLKCFKVKGIDYQYICSRYNDYSTKTTWYFYQNPFDGIPICKLLKKQLINSL